MAQALFWQSEKLLWLRRRAFAFQPRVSMCFQPRVRVSVWPVVEARCGCVVVTPRTASPVAKPRVALNGSCVATPKSPPFAILIFSIYTGLLYNLSSSSSIAQQKPAHAVPLASARQHPENQKERGTTASQSSLTTTHHTTRRRTPTLYRALHDGRPVFWCWRVLANSVTV